MTLMLATKGHELTILCRQLGWLGHRSDFQVWTQILVRGTVTSQTTWISAMALPQFPRHPKPLGTRHTGDARAQG